jgi:hypothetical protein
MFLLNSSVVNVAGIAVCPIGECDCQNATIRSPTMLSNVTHLSFAMGMGAVNHIQLFCFPSTQTWNEVEIEFTPEVQCNSCAGIVTTHVALADLQPCMSLVEQSGTYELTLQLEYKESVHTEFLLQTTCESITGHVSFAVAINTTSSVTTAREVNLHSEVFLSVASVVRSGSETVLELQVGVPENFEIHQISLSPNHPLTVGACQYIGGACVKPVIISMPTKCAEEETLQIGTQPICLGSCPFHVDYVHKSLTFVHPLCVEEEVDNLIHAELTIPSAFDNKGTRSTRNSLSNLRVDLFLHSTLSLQEFELQALNTPFGHSFICIRRSDQACETTTIEILEYRRYDTQQSGSISSTFTIRAYDSEPQSIVQQVVVEMVCLVGLSSVTAKSESFLPNEHAAPVSAATHRQGEGGICQREIYFGSKCVFAEIDEYSTCPCDDFQLQPLGRTDDSLSVRIQVLRLGQPLESCPLLIKPSNVTLCADTNYIGGGQPIFGKLSKGAPQPLILPSMSFPVIEETHLCALSETFVVVNSVKVKEIKLWCKEPIVRYSCSRNALEAVAKFNTTTPLTRAEYSIVVVNNPSITSQSEGVTCLVEVGSTREFLHHQWRGSQFCEFVNCAGWDCVFDVEWYYAHTTCEQANSALAWFVICSLLFVIILTLLACFVPGFSTMLSMLRFTIWGKSKAFGRKLKKWVGGDSSYRHANRYKFELDSISSAESNENSGNPSVTYHPSVDRSKVDSVGRFLTERNFELVVVPSELSEAKTSSFVNSVARGSVDPLLQSNGLTYYSGSKGRRCLNNLRNSKTFRNRKLQTLILAATLAFGEACGGSSRSYQDSIVCYESVGDKVCSTVSSLMFDNLLPHDYACASFTHGDRNVDLRVSVQEVNLVETFEYQYHHVDSHLQAEVLQIEATDYDSTDAAVLKFGCTTQAPSLNASLHFGEPLGSPSCFTTSACGVGESFTQCFLRNTPSRTMAYFARGPHPQGSYNLPYDEGYTGVPCHHYCSYLSPKPGNPTNASPIYKRTNIAPSGTLLVELFVDGVEVTDNASRESILSHFDFDWSFVSSAETLATLVPGYNNPSEKYVALTLEGAHLISDASDIASPSMFKQVGACQAVMGSTHHFDQLSSDSWSDIMCANSEIPSVLTVNNTMQDVVLRSGILLMGDVEKGPLVSGDWSNGDQLERYHRINTTLSELYEVEISFNFNELSLVNVALSEAVVKVGKPTVLDVQGCTKCGDSIYNISLDIKSTQPILCSLSSQPPLPFVSEKMLVHPGVAEMRVRAYHSEIKSEVSVSCGEEVFTFTLEFVKIPNVDDGNSGLVVDVSNATVLDPDSQREKKENWFQKIISGFKHFFHGIADFFGGSGFANFFKWIYGIIWFLIVLSVLWLLSILFFRLRSFYALVNQNLKKNNVKRDV